MRIDEIVKKLRAAKVQLCQNDPDIAIVVGGDGSFGYYGRRLHIPMLFVGVKETNILGSKAKLAETSYDSLCRAVKDIEAGKYIVAKKRTFFVSLNGHSTDVLTDVYLERGIFSGCLRYSVSIKILKKQSFSEYAIGNGVIISTSSGSGGYFSYPDRLNFGEWNNNPAHFSDNRIGICHIIPIYLVREKSGGVSQKPHIQYTIPFHSVIRIRLMRDVDSRLYGATMHSRGMSVGLGDEIVISGSGRTAKIIKLNS